MLKPVAFKINGNSPKAQLDDGCMYKSDSNKKENVPARR